MKRLASALLTICVVGTFASTGAFAEVQKLSSPQYKGHLLDWCLSWGPSETPQRCGGPVANRYCKYRGFKRSVGYKKWEDPGKTTKQIATGSICDAAFCDSYRFIMCEK